jgi:hypothetical protein
MQRGHGVLRVRRRDRHSPSISILLLSIYSLASLAESMPTNISTKNIIKSALNVNQTALKQSFRHIGIDIGLFLGY